MDDLSRKFLLLQDRVGTNVERSFLSLGLSTKQVPTQVYRGELLEALPEAEQPQDSWEIALGGIERKSLRLVCALDCVMRVTEEEANLLLAIYSLERRCQTYRDRNSLDFGERIGQGSRVFVTVKGISKKLWGLVRYKGKLSPGCSGTMFGVELAEEHQGLGTTDGTFRNKRYFTCPFDSGVFVGLDKLSPRDGSEAESLQRGESHRGADEVGQTAVDNPYGFEVGTRVEVPKAGVSRYGVIRWIGPMKWVKNKLVAGLELEDEQTACSDGTFNNERYFTCPAGRGFFTLLIHCRPDARFTYNSTGSDNAIYFGKEALPGHFEERPRPQPSSRKHARANLTRQLGQTEEQKDSVQIELMRTKEDLENCQKQLRERDEQLREKEKEQANSQRQLSEIEQRLTDCQEQLQEREAGLLEQLREKEQQQENSSRQLTDMEQRLANCQEQLQEREAGLLEQLREKEQQQENSQTQLNEMEQRLTNYQEQLQEREAGLLEQLREKEQQQENSQTQLNEMEQRLANFERHISENEAGKANLERQLGVKDQELNELEISLSAAQQTISELRRQETCDWVIARDEIQIKEKCLGKGGWGSVNEGTYCGCVVAVKQIHELILSPHNRRLFEREMNIASRCRHPCLLQFIGATNDEGSPLFVTELMETSLRALLEQRVLSEAEICVISLDVARALNYLHQRRPSPILHRDVSSANVLLWRQGDQWRGKVSDYGTAKFVQQTMTVAPGALIYSSPEAISSNQTAMVDVYSFGVLLCEMCIRELPDPERRDEQVVLVSNRVFRGLVRRCLETDPTMRPDMAQIIQELEQFNDTRS